MKKGNEKYHNLRKNFQNKKNKELMGKKLGQMNFSKLFNNLTNRNLKMKVLYLIYIVLKNKILR